MNRFVEKRMGWSGQSSSTLQIVISLNCSECIYKYVSEYRYDCPQCSFHCLSIHSLTLTLFSLLACSSLSFHALTYTECTFTANTYTHCRFIIIIISSNLHSSRHHHGWNDCRSMHTLCGNHMEHSSHRMCVFVGCRKSLLLPYMR